MEYACKDEAIVIMHDIMLDIEKPLYHRRRIIICI